MRPVNTQGCSVEGCERPFYAYEWCRPHWKRWWRHGDVQADVPIREVGPRAPDGEPLAWLIEAVKIETDECILWPYSVREYGYGIVRWKGKCWRAYHVALLLVGRELPKKPLEIRHLCGRHGCVNPRHLKVGTAKENQADKLIHGTHNRGERQWQHKLTEQGVREIRALIAQGIKYEDIAAQYDVSRTTISHIRHRKAWAHVTEETA